MSLSNLFDIPGPQDFLRALLALMQEFDSVPEDTMKPKMVCLTRLAIQSRWFSGEFSLTTSFFPPRSRAAQPFQRVKIT